MLLRTRTAVLLVRATVAAASVFAPVPAFPADPEAWVPARWQGGPLEIDRRAREGTLPDAPAVRDTIGTWYDLATLDLLKGTPVNCLLVTWSAGGSPEMERAQRAAVSAYARAAQVRGLAVLGLVQASAAADALFSATVEAGLDGLVLEGAFTGREALATTLRQLAREKGMRLVLVAVDERHRPASEPGVAAIADGVPAGVRDLGAEAEASPSSEPWIDFNFWLVQSVRAAKGPRPVWLMHTLPPQAVPADYVRAVSDAAATGGRWVLALNDELRHGLRTTQAAAIESWRQIAASLAFVQDRATWYAYATRAVCGFVQDSTGGDVPASGTTLRLAVRSRIPLRIIERSQLTSRALEGLRAVHAVDLGQLSDAERAILGQYAQAGGVLVVGSSWQKVDIPEHQDLLVRAAGTGRVALVRDEADPGEVAKSLVDLIGRDNLGVRLFRAASVLGHMSVDATGAEVLVHLLNYASYPAESVLVRVKGEFRKAQLHVPGSPPVDLRLEPDAGRVEVTVGRLPVYGVVRFEK